MMTGDTMKPISFSATRSLLVFSTCAVVCFASFAGKPEWAGQGGKHHSKQEQSGNGQTTVEVRIGAYFGDQQRSAAQNYYGTQYASKKCPPGLAKKNNGCLPPGQAKKWQSGKPLPSDVIFYPVPKEVVVKIGIPPAGYRYVRVANDLLLIAIGTNMVIDAIEDLMKP
jgi:Ni/Co efflux regulator RcnB